MRTREEILEYRREYRIKNRLKIKEQYLEYYRTHKESIKSSKSPRSAKSVRKHTLSKHGLTLESHQEIFDRQNGKCAICGIHQTELKKSLCVDHNHKTNMVRGLLCSKCNRGIGYLNDDINQLQNAVDYLKRFNIQ